MKKILATLALTAFMAVTTIAQTFEIGLTWQPNEEPDIKGYVVHQGTESRKYTTKTEVGQLTVFAARGLLPGTTYFFAVTAKNELFESDYSNEVELKTPGGGPVTEITGWKVQRSASKISITWDVAPVDQYVTKWKVVYALKGSDFSRTDFVTSPAFEFPVDHPDEEFIVTITAQGLQGDGPPVVLNIPKIPSAPIGLEIDQATLKLVYPLISP